VLKVVLEGVQISREGGVMLNQLDVFSLDLVHGD
jgi:hypothetical protein